jgi:DHA3 family macrolide efflux protein-like MFS transporter
MKEYKAVLKDTEFLYLWNSQLLSQVSINILNFILLLKLFEHTGSTIATSMLWVAYSLPALIAGPFASATVDMVDRKKILMITNILQSITIFAYALIVGKSIFLIYGVVLAYSFLNQFYVPAEAATVPALVNKKQLPLANSMFFITQQVALIIGFAVAGFINEGLGFQKSVFLCSLLLFLAFISVSFLPKQEVKDKIPADVEKAFLKFFNNIYEGYKFIRSNNIILAPFLLLITVMVLGYVITVNSPLIAQDIFGIETSKMGLYMIVPLGVGAVTGSLVIPKLLSKGKRKKNIVDNSILLMTLSFFSVIFLLPMLNDTLSMMFGFISMFLVGLTFIGILIPSQTLLQEVTPGGMRGRVFGNFWFITTVITMFPVIFSGAISEIFGIRVLLFMVAGVLFAVWIFSNTNGDKFIRNGLDYKKYV